MADVVILGGPNGAGETTAAQVVLPRQLDIREFVTADEIAPTCGNAIFRWQTWLSFTIIRTKVVS